MKTAHATLCLAGTALALTAPLALAQSSVSLFGNVDVGIQHSSRSVASVSSSGVLTGDAGRLTELFPGGISPSIWGMRAVEDLGGGLSAFFNLEAQFLADTGASVGAGQIFRRQANIGLQGKWGSVTLGRQFTPAILAHSYTEPRGFKEQLSLLYPFAYTQTTRTVPVGAVAGNDIGAFAANAITLNHRLGPVNVAAMYALGEKSGNFNAGREVSLGANYKGPVDLSLSYQDIRSWDNSSVSSRQWAAGAAVPLGQVIFKGMYLNTRSDAGAVVTTSNSDVHALGLGVDWNWQTAHTLTLAYYHAKDRDASADRTRTVVLSNDYALSKRSTLYVQVALADADAGASRRTSMAAAGTPAGFKTTLFGLGVKHSF